MLNGICAFFLSKAPTIHDNEYNFSFRHIIPLKCAQSYKKVKVLFNLVLLLPAADSMAHFSFLPGQTMFMQRILLFSSIAFLFLASSFKPVSGLDEVIGALRSGN